MRLEDFLPGVPDFPKPGIFFRDISPLLANADAFASAIQGMGQLSQAYPFTHILGIESRGFIFAAALANHLTKGLVLVRKPNKLPPETHRESYGLEYGNDALEISTNVLSANDSVLVVDDVLATGGTIMAAHQLIGRTGAKVSGAICLLEIAGLEGAERLRNAGVSNQCLLKM